MAIDKDCFKSTASNADRSAIAKECKSIPECIFLWEKKKQHYPILDAQDLVSLPQGNQLVAPW